MPSRLELAVASAAAALGIAFVGVLGTALAACIDGEGLDLERAPVADATTHVEASTPPADAGPRTGDSGCSLDLTTDPANCGACGKVCTLATLLDGGADAAGGDDSGASTLVAACVASACTVACAPGRADCNGTMADGCEVSLLSDPKNCGACATSCGSQACDAGACPYGVLLEDGGTYAEIAVNDASVFAGVTAPVPGVVELSKVGGPEAFLSRGTPSAGLALDDAGHVTFSDPTASAIEQAPVAIPLEAGAPAVLYAAIPSPRELTYASGALVWVQAYDDGNMTTPSQSGIFTTGGALVVSSTSYVRDLATTVGAVYFAGQDWIATPPLTPAMSLPEYIYACALPVCAAAGAISTTPYYRVYDVATDGKNLFWTSWGNVNDKSGFLVACNLAACSPAPIASELERPEAIVSDGSTVYWFELGLGAIRSLPIPAAGADAGVPTTVATGLVGVTNLALDATYIYWDQPSLGEIDRARR